MVKAAVLTWLFWFTFILPGCVPAQKTDDTEELETDLEIDCAGLHGEDLTKCVNYYDKRNQKQPGE